jgi:hypothetical protein
MRNKEMATAWSTWVDTIREEKKMKHTLEIVMKRMRNREMSSAWAAWVDTIQEQQKMKHLLLRVTKRMQNRGMSTAWATWANNVKVSRNNKTECLPLKSSATFNGDFAEIPDPGSADSIAFEDNFKQWIVQLFHESQVYTISTADVHITGYRGGSVVVDFFVTRVPSAVASEIGEAVREEANKASQSRRGLWVGDYRAARGPIAEFTIKRWDDGTLKRTELETEIVQEEMEWCLFGCGFCGSWKAVHAHENFCDYQEQQSSPLDVRVHIHSAEDSPGTVVPSGVVTTTTAAAAKPSSEKDWDEMNSKEKRAVEQLGWTPQSWQAGAQEPFNRSWRQLSKQQRRAATLLGYTKGDFASPGEGRDEGPRTPPRARSPERAPGGAASSSGQIASPTPDMQIWWEIRSGNRIGSDEEEPPEEQQLYLPPGAISPSIASSSSSPARGLSPIRSPAGSPTRRGSPARQRSPSPELHMHVYSDKSEQLRELQRENEAAARALDLARAEARAAQEASAQAVADAEAAAEEAVAAAQEAAYEREESAARKLQSDVARAEATAAQEAERRAEAERDTLEAYKQQDRLAQLAARAETEKKAAQKEANRLVAAAEANDRNSEQERRRHEAAVAAARHKAELADAARRDAEEHRRQTDQKYQLHAAQARDAMAQTQRENRARQLAQQREQEALRRMQDAEHLVTRTAEEIMDAERRRAIAEQAYEGLQQEIEDERHARTSREMQEEQMRLLEEAAARLVQQRPAWTESDEMSSPVERVNYHLRQAQAGGVDPFSDLDDGEGELLRRALSRENKSFSPTRSPRSPRSPPTRSASGSPRFG